MNTSALSVLSHLRHALPRHGDPPVVGAVVDHEELHLERVVGHDQPQQHHRGHCDQGLEGGGIKVLLQKEQKRERER